MSRSKKAGLAATLLSAQTSLAGMAAAAEDVEIKTTDEPVAVSARDEHQEESTFSPHKKEPARMAVAVNPIGLIFGLLLAEFDYGLGDNLSLNINAEYWNFSVTKAYGLGVGAQIFLPEVADSGPLYQGFYLYPSLQVLSVSVESILFSDDYSYLSVAPRFIAGWQWDWRPFTVRLGLGAEYYIASAKTGYDVDLRGLRFVGDGTLGLTF